MIRMGFIGLAREKGVGSTCLFACMCCDNRVSLRVCFILFYYPRKHRVFEALGAGVPIGHPLASACCSWIVTIVIATTPNNASAATISITPNDVILLLLSLFILSSSPMGGSNFHVKH